MTGSAGFIGTNLLERLSEQVETIFAVDDFSGLLYSSQYKVRNQESTSRIKNIKFRQANLASTKLTQDEINVDVVINLAALPGQVLSWDHLPEYTNNNLLLVWNLLEQFKTVRMPKWIQASTSSVYGTNAVSSEFERTNPSNPYGVTKLAAENLLLSYTENFSLEHLSMRFFSVYGPRQRPDMGIHKFLSSALADKPIEIYGSGKQSRDLSFVEDVVTAVLSAVALPTLPNTAVNISGGQSYSVEHIVRTCIELTGSKSKIKYIPTPVGDQYATQNTSEYARELLNFYPNTSLEMGLTKQIEWLKGGAK